jgi:hypothetical protein
MTDKNLPSIEYLHKRLRYEPETGKLFWRDCEDMPKHWRSRFAGKEAFTPKTGHGYLHGRLAGKKIYAHRMVWAIYYGEWPQEQLDHINGDRADNRIFNLREVSNTENAKNRGLMSNNKSGVCGVYWCKANQNWTASVKINGKNKHLGSFSDISEAKAARAKAQIALGYSKRHGV